MTCDHPQNICILAKTVVQNQLRKQQQLLLFAEIHLQPLSQTISSQSSIALAVASIKEEQSDLDTYRQGQTQVPQ